MFSFHPVQDDPDYDHVKIEVISQHSFGENLKVKSAQITSQHIDDFLIFKKIFRSDPATAIAGRHSKWSSKKKKSKNDFVQV